MCSRAHVPGAALPEGLHGAIIEAMVAHAENSFVQIAACQVLRSMIAKAKDDSPVWRHPTMNVPFAYACTTFLTVHPPAC